MAVLSPPWNSSALFVYFRDQSAYFLPYFLLHTEHWLEINHVLELYFCVKTMIVGQYVGPDWLVASNVVWKSCQVELNPKTVRYRKDSKSRTTLPIHDRLAEKINFSRQGLIL